MAWLLLVASGVMETIWVVSLDKSAGFSQPVPTIVFVIFYILSVLGLGIALKELPVGTAYAVWVGIGAGLTALYSMLSGAEPVSILRIMLLLGIVGCVAGLKLISS